jgi:acetolactate synthase-1/3 small subunit
MPQHEFILKVHNHPGVLIRVAQVFTRRSFNIDALEVKPDPKNPVFATMHIKAKGDGEQLNQIKLQISKLIDVIEVL